MRYLSVCSGIEAATVAWHPLGWTAAAFSEIEAFPRAVLQHHYPHVPLHGDFTTIGADDYGPIDLLVGGTPCQSFSVAGLRGGLADERGNLSLEYIRLARRKRARWVGWENVPGVFSSNGGRDFQCFLSGLVGWLVPVPVGGWQNSGIIAAGPADGSYGVAWRVLDAQHFGVPQRRRRIILVGYLGDWRRAAAVLFERHSLSGDSPPRRKKGKAAPTIPSRSSAGGGLGTDFDLDGGLVESYVPEIVGQAMSCKWSKGTSGPAGDEHHNLVAGTLSAAGSRSRGAGTDPAMITPPLTGNHYGDHESREGLLVTHALRAEGFDASEDGTGRGTPLVPVPFDTTQITSAANYSNPQPGDPCHPLAAAAHPPAVAFDLRGREGGSQFEGPHDSANIRAASGGSSRSYIAFDARQSDACVFGDRTGPMDTKQPGPSVAFTISENANGFAWEGEVNPTLQRRAQSPASNQFDGIRERSGVRRLVPRECERLQGFPDDYTLVPYRGKLAADGPRYKALGNSMAVPVMSWIGQRIAAVEALQTRAEAA